MDGSELKSRAKQIFAEQRGNSILAVLLMFAGTFACSFPGQILSSIGNRMIMNGDNSGSIWSLAGSIVTLLLQIFLLYAFLVGMQKFFLDAQKGKPQSAVPYATEFIPSHSKSMGMAIFGTGLYIGLWSLLFVIPGILKGLSWSQVGFILAENPDMTGKEARALSEKMMKGHRMEYFMLNLSFIGWIFLSLFTFGILMIVYVEPYMLHTFAGYHNELKAQMPDGESM